MASMPIYTEKKITFFVLQNQKASGLKTWCEVFGPQVLSCFGLGNADQWKPDYRVVTIEKPRNQEFFSTDQ